MVTLASPSRSIAADEIAHYRDHGWVKLEGFVAPDVLATLLATARERMGEDGDSNPPLQAMDIEGTEITFFNFEAAHGLTNPKFRPLLEAVGSTARTMMRRRPGIEARYYTDYFLVKLPAGKASRHGGNGATDYHQDFPAWAVDRSGGMTFWIALTDIPPEQGTMCFVSGSHRVGALGNYHTGDVLEDYPELLENCTLTPPMSYKTGDVTVHSNMIAHGAGENLTDRPRWAYSIQVNPSDVRWNGAPAEGFDTRNMTVLDPIDNERFPLLGVGRA